MERLIVKTAIYSFFSWLVLVFIFYPRETVFTNGSMHHIEVRPLGEYLHGLLWLTTVLTVVTFVLIVSFLLFSRFNERKNDGKY